jgi:hypothetical protein
MNWRKTALAIPPPTHLPWAETHAAVPHAESLDDRQAVVYFTSRDEHRRSHIARATLELDAAPGAVDVEPEPVLAPGPRGAFDDSGVMTSCLVREGGFEWLYYQGWSLGVTVPFYVFVGCARRATGEARFTRVSPSPVMGRDDVDPFMCSSPWVVVEGGVWRMWYVSNLGWSDGPNGRPQYRVHIKYAESENGLDWRRTGRVCIDFADPTEYAISRPCVVRDPDRYRMWYSMRGPSYRIGYAESDDGLTWRRYDAAAGIDVSPSGWDSEMVEYACVFDHGGRRHMLYNGNGFGATGIGHAVAEGAGVSTRASDD